MTVRALRAKASSLACPRPLVSLASPIYLPKSCREAATIRARLFLLMLMLMKSQFYAIHLPGEAKTGDNFLCGNFYPSTDLDENCYMLVLVLKSKSVLEVLL